MTGYQKITTKPTLIERVNRSPVLCTLVLFLGLFAIIGAGEVLGIVLELAWMWVTA